MKQAFAVLALCLFSTAAIAQSPYAGMQARGIKALSDQQITDLRAGRGMGLALPAELNGYPGPVHVLELADRLGLSGEQREKFQAMFAAMKAEAVPLGERLILLEGALDRDFATRSITPESLAAATRQIAEAQGALRNAHLKYHLASAALLTPAQLHAYAGLRGYSAQHPGHGHRQ